MLRPHAATITGNFADLSLTIPRARPPPGSLVPGPGLPADSIEASIVGDTLDHLDAGLSGSLPGLADALRPPLDVHAVEQPSRTQRSSASTPLTSTNETGGGVSCVANQLTPTRRGPTPSIQASSTSSR